MAHSYADLLVPILKEKKLEHRRNVFEDVQPQKDPKHTNLSSFGAEKKELWVLRNKKKELLQQGRILCFSEGS